MKNLSIIVFYLLLLNIANAQKETTTWQYQLDDNQIEAFQVKNQVKTIELKTQNLYQFRNQEFFLGAVLKKAIEEGKLTVYKDKKCRKAMTIEEAKAKMVFTSLDTIITYNPETFEGHPTIVENRTKLFPIDETIYEFTQSWNFKSSTQKLQLDAIHISHYDLANEPNKDRKNYLFSIKAKDLKNLENSKILEIPNVIWARYIEYKGNFENTKIREQLLSKSHLLEHKIINNGYDDNPLKDYFIFEAAEIQSESFMESVDTIITFHPETFAEKMMIRRYKLNLDDITSFKIAQEIYFDTKDYTFKVRLLAIAPILRRYDEFGKFRYESPLFWIVYEEDFLKWFD